MDIVCATDGNYLPHCVAMLQSLWEHNKRSDLRVYLITDNADQKDLGITLSHLHRLLRPTEATVIVNCPDRAQFTGSRSLKQAAPESIWLFQESLILMSVLRSSRLLSCICRTAMEARMTTDNA
jgi:lipopolysaccharide biosynthesis glycosyltransferase